MLPNQLKGIVNCLHASVYFCIYERRSAGQSTTLTRNGHTIVAILSSHHDYIIWPGYIESYSGLYKLWIECDLISWEDRSLTIGHWERYGGIPSSNYIYTKNEEWMVWISIANYLLPVLLLVDVVTVLWSEEHFVWSTREISKNPSRRREMHWLHFLNYFCTLNWKLISNTSTN